MPVGGQQVFASDVAMPPPVQAGDGVDQSTSSSTASMGSPSIGVVFTAPPSGRVRLHLFGGLRLTVNANGAVYLGVQVRTGAVIGSGSMVFDGLNTEPGCRVFYTGALAYITSASSAMVEGLTPAAQYNASLWHFVTPTSTTTGVIMARQVGVDPLP